VSSWPMGFSNLPIRWERGSGDFVLYSERAGHVSVFSATQGRGLAWPLRPGAPGTCGELFFPEMTGRPGSSFCPTEHEGAPEAVFWQGRTKEIEDLAGFCLYMGSFFGAHALR